ncbi:MAG: hypothetical protein QOF48_910 [Verrucomicrobiota bacterium]|jgi:hypothetical protein
MALRPEARARPGQESFPMAAPMGPAERCNQWFTPWRFALLLLLFVFAAYPDVLLGLNTFFYRDYGLFGYPLAHYHREAFWRGEIPFWNSLSNCGIPHLAQWNTMTLYPLSIIYLLFPMPWSLGFFCLGHLFLGGIGMYFLANRWTSNRFAAAIAGVAYAINGLMLHALMWPNNIAALGWMPLVILCIDHGVRFGGRQTVIAVLAATMQMLAGAPEIILFTWLLAGAFCAVTREAPWQARWRRFAVAALLTAMVASAQLLPFLDLMVHSQRDQKFGTDVWAMPSWGWANLLVPLFRCTASAVGVYSQDAQQWTSSYYAGIGILALAILGATRGRDRRVLVLVTAVLAGLVLALGSAGGLLTLLKKIIPGLGVVRFPIKFVVIPIFAMPLLAAMAVARWHSAADLAGAIQRRRWFGISGALFVLIGCVVMASWMHPATGEHAEVTARSGATRALFLIAAAVLLVLGNRWTGTAGLSLRLGFIALLGLDVLTHAPRQNPTVPTAALSDGIPRDDRFKTEGRVMVSARTQAFFDFAATSNTWEFCRGHRRALLPNWNLVEGIASAGGFYSLYTAPQSDLRALWASGTNVSRSLADVFGARWISSEANLFGWDERRASLAILTAGQGPIFADREQTLRALASSALDPASEVLLPRAAEGHVHATSVVGARVVSSRAGNGVLEAQIEADGPTFVTVGQTDYPGWTATVNGRPARIWRANHAFQALEVPAGTSRVRLAYRERTFAAGAGFSLAGLLICAGLWSWGRRHRAEESPPLLAA